MSLKCLAQMYAFSKNSPVASVNNAGPQKSRWLTNGSALLAHRVGRCLKTA